MIQIKIFKLLPLYTHKLGKLHKGSKITSINLLAYLKVRMGDFSQDRGGSRYILLPHTTKRRTTTNLKTKQELPENQTIWKSDTQGVKEETFT